MFSMCPEFLINVCRIPKEISKFKKEKLKMLFLNCRFTFFPSFKIKSQSTTNGPLTKAVYP